MLIDGGRDDDAAHQQPDDLLQLLRGEPSVEVRAELVEEVEIL